MSIVKGPDIAQQLDSEFEQLVEKHQLHHCAVVLVLSFLDNR